MVEPDFDTLAFLQARPHEIEAQARECVRAGGAGGGYVLGSGCVVPRAAPKENLQALRRAAELYGRYDQGTLVETAEG